jgi:hypothetical protein
MPIDFYLSYRSKLVRRSYLCIAASALEVNKQAYLPPGENNG